MSTVVSSNASEQETDELRRGPWTLEEDNLLVRYITCHGEGRWNLLAKCAGLKRTGKSCRLRWLNYLKPDIKRGNLTHHEQLLILELHSKWGNRWSKIAQHLPGRTDNEIKNYWRTRVQKQARHLKIESNSKRFVEAIRCAWMPRLIEQMEQTSSLSPSPYSTPAAVLEAQCSAVSPLLLKLQASFPQPAKIGSDSFDQPIQNLRSMSTSSIFGSDDPPRDSQLQPETSEYLASPAHHAFGYNTNYNRSLLTSGGFHGVKEFNQLDSSMSAVGLNDFPISDSQLAGNDWIGVDMACSLWNMDEMGQFRQLEVLLGI